MSIILKTLSERQSNFKQILEPLGTVHPEKNALKNFNFPNSSHQLKLWWKLEMLVTSKTVRYRAISSKYLMLWCLETLDVMPLKNFRFPNSRHHLEFW